MAKKANAQAPGLIDVIGPGDDPLHADIVSRGAGHAAGLAGRDGEHRQQEAAVNTGHKATPHRLAHAKAGNGSKKAGRNSRENDARALRNLHKASKPLPDLGK